MNRRKFLETIGTSATAAAIIPNQLFSQTGSVSKKLRIGIIGGRFGADFNFQEHPDCIVEAVSDLIPERRQRLINTYKCNKSYPSLTELLKDPKIDAVFIATGAPDHAKHTIESLRAGKHVFCAVPVGMTLDECSDVLDEVKRSGLKYMMTETSIWRQTMISVKHLYAEGAFGNFMSFATHYNHPGLESLYIENGKKTWRYGLPPMLYCA